MNRTRTGLLTLMLALMGIGLFACSATQAAEPAETGGIPTFDGINIGTPGSPMMRLWPIPGGGYYVSFNALLDHTTKEWHRDIPALGSQYIAFPTSGASVNVYTSKPGTDPIAWGQAARFGPSDNRFWGNMQVAGEIAWQLGTPSHLYHIDDGVASDGRIHSLKEMRAPLIVGETLSGDSLRLGAILDLGAYISELESRLASVESRPQYSPPSLSGVYDRINQVEAALDALPPPSPDVSGRVAELEEANRALIEALIAALGEPEAELE